MIQKLPTSVIRSIELLGLVLLGVVITQLKSIIIPILIALVAAIALLPVYRFFVRRKIPNTISIFLSLLLMFTVLGLIVFFIATQLKPLMEDFATIKQNILQQVNLISNWIGSHTSFSTSDQSEMINKQSNSFLDSAGNYLSNALGSITSIFIFFGLFPIYTFLILYYRKVIKQFVMMWFHNEDSNNVSDTLKSIESIINSYIMGLMIQLTYMTILLGGTLLLFGIPYALLIAVIFAVLNLIPYIGALLGNLIGILLTLSSSPDLGSVATVLIVITVVQFLDNNILMPSIVGSKIKINALVSLLAVFLGGALAGIGGMFLSLPIMASLKVIFDHTESYKKWGVLLGDQQKPSKLLMKIKKLK